MIFKKNKTKTYYNVLASKVQKNQNFHGCRLDKKCISMLFQKGTLWSLVYWDMLLTEFNLIAQFEWFGGKYKFY